MTQQTSESANPTIYSQTKASLTNATGFGPLRKTYPVSLLLIVLVAIFSACAASPEVIEVTRVVTEVVETEANTVAATAPAAAPNRVNDAIAFDGSEGGATQQQGDTAVQTVDRLIIRSADLHLTVPDTEQAIADISSRVEGSGGWVVSSNVFTTAQHKRGSIIVRIPAQGFNDALDSIKALATEVTRESISGQDVTEEFVDLTLRLENLEATADRVRAFLDDATRVEDALAVNRELSRLEEEIELIKGRQQYLSQSAAYSTITIALLPDAAVQPPDFARWSPQGIAKNAIEALVDTLQGVGGFLIWLAIYILPVALLVFVPLFALGRFLLRRWWWRRDAVEEAGTA